ncbi:MAG: zinc-ribbon domain-containing protein, partial [Myxococcota bacterium]|nr:zinc-ribbon domain-containing protein [Myxococcota bacterium]
MKIVCEACGQRYAISDQKVVGPGRVFKVTCRQCSHGIIVRGITEEVASVSDEWHYVVGRERKGPVDRETLARMVYDGTLDERTYLWAS